MDKSKRRTIVTYFSSAVIYYFLLIVRLLLRNHHIESQAEFWRTITTFILIMVLATLSGFIIMKDAQSNGKQESAVIWGILCFIIPPITILIYLVSKKKILPKNNLFLLISCTVFVLGAVSLGNTLIDTSRLNKGIIALNYDLPIGNTWRLSFKSASNGFAETKKFDYNKPAEQMYVEVDCSEGELMIALIQNEIVEEYQVSEGKFDKIINLKKFKKGQIKMVITINGAKNTSIIAKLK